MSNEFTTPIDICNRAMQHLGQQRIDPQLGFNEISKRASECAACYDKLRAAELRQNIWRFAIKRASLRAINSIAMNAMPFVVSTTPAGAAMAPSMLVSPPLWSQYITYTLGALVTDSIGSIWQSQVPANINNLPGYSTAWEEYFGPLTVDYFDNAPTQPLAYYPGELVYNFTGAGVGYTVYQSLMNGNAQPPTVPMPWVATQVYSQDDTTLVYPNWSSVTTYAAGNAVLYTDGNYYASLTAGNLNNPPATSPAAWVLFPLTTNSVTGQIVTGIAEWSQLTTYAFGNFVDFGGVQYIATGAPALGAVPTAGGAWAAIANGTLYQSLVNLNLNNAPASSAAAWSTAITSGAGSNQWKTLGVLLSPLGIVYPLGAGPQWQNSTRNAYRLPAGYLRRAPQAPRAGSFSWLGVPGNIYQDDWEFESSYLVSRETGPIPFRFVGNVTQVSKMDPMFCEGLATRIAVELCETLTQSTDKLQNLGQMYKEFMGAARLANSIEVGPQDAPLDDWIACRI